MKFSELIEIIEEEILNVMEEKAKAAGDEDQISAIEELREAKVRAPKGKRWRHNKKTVASFDPGQTYDKQKDTYYHSAGSVDTKRNRQMSPQQIEMREKLGSTMLKAFDRSVGGGKKGKAGKTDLASRKLKANIIAHGLKKSKNKNQSKLSRDEINSFIWALASDMALEGETDWRQWILNGKKKRLAMLRGKGTSGAGGSKKTTGTAKGSGSQSSASSNKNNPSGGTP